MRCSELMRDAGEPRPFGAPRYPCLVDEDGDIVDADGWVICSAAKGVWHNDMEHAESICRCLNGRA